MPMAWMLFLVLGSAIPQVVQTRAPNAESEAQVQTLLGHGHGRTLHQLELLPLTSWAQLENRAALVNMRPRSGELKCSEFAKSVICRPGRSRLCPIFKSSVSKCEPLVQDREQCK